MLPGKTSNNNQILWLNHKLSLTKEAATSFQLRRAVSVANTLNGTVEGIMKIEDMLTSNAHPRSTLDRACQLKVTTRPSPTNMQMEYLRSLTVQVCKVVYIGQDRTCACTFHIDKVIHLCFGANLLSLGTASIPCMPKLHYKNWRVILTQLVVISLSFLNGIWPNTGIFIQVIKMCM